MKYYQTILYPSNFFLVLMCFFFMSSCNLQKDELSKIEISHENIRIANELQEKADSFNNISQLDNAFQAYLQSNTYFNSQNKEESITYNNLRIATIYLNIGDPNSAQEIVTKELPNIINKDNSYKVYIYNTLAICYSELKDYSLAIKYFNLSLEIANSEEEKIILLNNIASNHINLDQDKEAIIILKDLVSSETFQNNLRERARILNNLGKALSMKNKSLGLPELQESLDIRLKINNQLDILKSYTTLSEYYLINNNFILAHDYALKAYEITKSFDSKNDKLNILEYLLKSNPNEATKYLNEYVELSKTIALENQQAKNQFAKIRYDFEQHEQENIKLKLNLQHSELISARRKIGLFTFVFIFTGGILILFFIYRKIKQRHRLDKNQQVYLTETKIAKKVHDELANDVFNTLTYIQNFNLNDNEAKNHLSNDLELIYKKARNISLELKAIDTDEHFIDTLTNIFNEYSTQKCKVIVTGLSDDILKNLSSQQKITLYRVIQELLVNMKKHSMATLVIFKFKESNKRIELFYSDNGVGIIQEQIKRKNGIANMETRIKNIGGSFIFDSDNKIGVKYKIQFPKKYV
ncbi:tetratricopeptide repeat-containing sensor histidine kinase [Myroides injenensis]|uniref:tetratricopeptide repeat-containing sensor histidine kinase n=1 Tax=Myroides injenensis TaxID=1183151 RepID=UPI0004746D08|nr:tetratricopeptide repeat-containing sensor histidine kinase [Myroides injenensis]